MLTVYASSLLLECMGFFRVVQARPRDDGFDFLLIGLAVIGLFAWAINRANHSTSSKK
jgi:hypothetical protein